MDLDSFIKLNDAQIRSAESQATVADKLADIPDKLAHADLTEEQAVNQHLKNVSLALNIQWDAQAHRQLLAMRNQSLQRAARLRDNRELWREKTMHCGWLLAGNLSLTAVEHGWIGFEFLRLHMPLSAAVKVAGIKPDLEAFAVEAWSHPTHAVTHPVTTHNGGALLHWARINNFYPNSGGPAAAYIADILTAMADAAAAEAAELDRRTAVAEASAMELEKFDWGRLLKPAGLGTN